MSVENVDDDELRRGVEQVLKVAEEYVRRAGVPENDVQPAIAGLLVSAWAGHNGRQFARLEGREPTIEEFIQAMELMLPVVEKVFTGSAREALRRASETVN